jgi:hypothetical protein
VLAHDWLVLNVEPSSEDDASLLVVSSLEDEAVVADVVVAVAATVVVSAPIEPVNATTPQASTNVARTAATTRRRSVAMWRARAASLSWGEAEGMP